MEEDYRVKGIREITDALLAVNSAFSFLLYCSMSRAFRAAFLHIFCPFRKPPSPERIPITAKGVDGGGEGGGRNGVAEIGAGGGNNETYL